MDRVRSPLPTLAHIRQGHIALRRAGGDPVTLLDQNDERRAD